MAGNSAEMCESRRVKPGDDSVPEREHVNGGRLDVVGGNATFNHVILRVRIMWRGILVLLLSAASIAAADARPRQINPIPFAHEPCSVLDYRPCTPSYCSPLEPGPCIPEIDYPYGQDLQLTIQSVPSEADRAIYQKPDHDLDTIGDLFAALRSCWSPPSDKARAGMQMSVRFSFNKAGSLIGPPRLTYATAGVPAETRTSYLDAINASLKACLPLKFTGGLGGALAGRPIAIRYVDNRELGK
jgi:hypothetical protein